MGRLSKEQQAEIQEILELLPEEPDRFATEVLYTDESIDEIGGNLLLIERFPEHRHRVPLKECMCPEDWEEYAASVEKVWGAEMVCTFCGERFSGRWIKRAGQGPAFVLDEDDSHVFGIHQGYGVEGWEQAENGLLAVGTDGNEASCPCCGHYCVTHPIGWIGKGKTFRQMVATLERFGRFAGVIYWMEHYHIDQGGTAMLEILPRDALVAGTGGRLYRFTHVSKDRGGEYDAGCWTYGPTPKTLLGQIPYRSALARGGEQRRAQWLSWVCGTDTEGTSLEHSAVDRIADDMDLMTDDPALPEQYLRFWAEHPSAENLVRNGWRDVVISAIRGDLGGLDWSRTKPHEILGLQKSEYRLAQAERVSPKQYMEFRQYQAFYPNEADMAEYLRMKAIYRNNLSLVLDRGDGTPEWSPQRVDRYLQRQGQANDFGLLLLVDYRCAARELNALHTARDWWPKQLQAKHDETAGAQIILQSKERLAFLTLQKWLEGTAWSDGRWCIRAARTPEELIEEGRVLHHCVGNYAGKMAGKSDVIFFIRKARRPERSWLTLDIRMDGMEPSVVQLHGYYNEHAPQAPDTPWSRKTWNIPQAAWDFVDRWMREVLKPWWNKRHGKIETKKARRTA